MTTEAHPGSAPAGGDGGAGPATPLPGRAECAARDAADPLAGLRDEFVLPDGIIYLDGNSLGALPRRTAARVGEVIEREWGEGLVRSFNEAGWWELPCTLGDRLAPLLGAGPGEVVVCDSTSVNLFKTLSAALRLRPGRRAVVSDAACFPTDLYIADGLSGLVGGLDHRLVEGDDLEAALDGVLDERVAVVVLSHVDYRTGRLHDMAAITERAHRHGALMIWDVCHSAGAVPVELGACGVDFAVGCTYKYLNGGPGAPAFLYAAPRHLAEARQPISGWWGHADPFSFETGYVPAPGIRRFLVGSAPILGCASLQASLDIWERVDPAALRAKSLALTGLFMEFGDRLGLELATPRDPARRGGQVAFRHPHGFAIVQALIERGVIGDFRTPDIMRFGFAPLYLSHGDVWEAGRVLTEVVESGCWRDARYSARGTVT